MAALASALGALALPAAAPANHSPFDVNDAGDASDANPGNGTCATAAALCTLRAAIEEANAHAGTTDSITFSIGAADSQQTITVTATAILPAITAPVTIDGTTQCATACTTPKIEIDGNNAVDGVDGPADHALRLGAGADGSAVKGLIVNDANDSGISLNAADSNVIQGNWIGIENDGTGALPNREHGIRISQASASDNNVIGGIGAAERNVIAGNALAGIRLESGASNAIKGNYVGLQPDGSTVQPNLSFGISDAAANTSIGGTAAGEGNVISGHAGVMPDDAGVLVAGSANGTLIQGNRIGTDSAGTLDRGNRDGIRVAPTATATTIGGAVIGARNQISGNNDDGIESQGVGTAIRLNLIGTTASGTAALGNQFGVYLFLTSGTTSLGGVGVGNVISGNINNGVKIEGGSGTLTVRGNYIGLSESGAAALGNGNQGLRVDNAGFPVTIGGSTAGTGNVISANVGAGIRLAASGVTVQGNLVGTDAAGGGTAAFGNDSGDEEAGIWLADTANSNVIGGAGAGEGNTVTNTVGGPGIGARYELGPPVLVAGAGNRIRGNSVFNNAGLGIDLARDGITANDANDVDMGPTGLGFQNFPALTSASRDASTVNVAGSLHSVASGTFDVDLFANSACDPLGNGEGEFFLGSTTVMTDGSGNASFSVSLPTTSPAGANQITATATRTDIAAGDSSEFSPCRTAGAISTGSGTPSTTPAVVENPECAELRARLAKLNRKIKRTDDPEKKAKLKEKRRKVRKRLRDLGC